LSKAPLRKGDTPEAVDAEPAERVQDDPVAGQPKFEVAIGGLFDDGDDLLPGSAEIEDDLAHLVGLAPVALEEAEAEENGLDPVVDLGLAHVRPEIVHGQRPGAEEERGQRVWRRDLRDRPGEADLEQAAAGDLDRAPADVLENEEEDAGRGQQQEEEDDQTDVSGFSHGGSSFGVLLSTRTARISNFFMAQTSLPPRPSRRGRAMAGETGGMRNVLFKALCR
jgi:hypothetical protein